MIKPGQISCSEQQPEWDQLPRYRPGASGAEYSHGAVEKCSITTFTLAFTRFIRTKKSAVTELC
jgi:hypothetical protein